MSALSPPERHPLPRFLDANDADPQWVLNRAGVQAALFLYWEATSACAGHLDRLDRWAGRHDTVADAGEARDDAAADILACTVLLHAACDALEAVLAHAQARPA